MPFLNKLSLRKLMNVGCQSIHFNFEASCECVAVLLNLLDFLIYAACVFWCWINSVSSAMVNCTCSGFLPILSISVVHCKNSLTLIFVDFLRLYAFGWMWEHNKIWNIPLTHPQFCPCMRWNNRQICWSLSLWLVCSPKRKLHY